MGSISEHIGCCLAPDPPPRNPLLRENWSGLAFDRNRYEELAPEGVWSARFECHIEKPREPKRIGITSVAELMQGKDGLQVPADFVALKGYWAEGLKFLSDHFVFSLAHDWIVRLDQDVTVFSGDAAFINAMMAKLGGRNRVIAMMVDDFSPGPEDKAGLGQYIKAITRSGI